MQQSNWDWIMSEFLLFVAENGMQLSVARLMATPPDTTIDSQTLLIDPEEVRLTFDRSMKTMINGRVAVHQIVFDEKLQKHMRRRRKLGERQRDVLFDADNYDFQHAEKH